MDETRDTGTRYDTHPTAGRDAVQLKDIRKRLPLRVLSEADWTHWTTYGFVVVPHAVPAARRR